MNRISAPRRFVPVRAATPRPVVAEGGMRAVVFREFGPPAALELVEGYNAPVRQKGELLVQVHATSVNPIDCKIRRGDIPLASLQTVRPKVLGGDVAGVVLDADPDAWFKPGMRVAFLSDTYRWDKPYGSYAELATVPERHVALLPDTISFQEAAGLPLAALTAQQALDPLDLQRGQRVLIHAGAGGVGCAAIQIAKSRGLRVTTTCSGRNMDFVRDELGADVAIDYTMERFEEVCQTPFDCVLDLVGGDYEPRSLKVLKKWGTYISVFARGDLLAAARGIAFGVGPGARYHVVLVQPSAWQMDAALRLVQQGKLKPIVDRVYPLEQAREAHEYVEKGHTRGKVILTVRSEN